MKKILSLSAITLILTITGAKLATAADLDYYEYKDRSYIDRTLDEYERRTGKYNGQYNGKYNGKYVGEYKNQYKNKHKYNPDYKDYSGNHYKNKKGYNPAYKQKHHSDERWDNGCLPQRKIRRRLIKRGWHDFQPLHQGPRRMRVLATNYNGRRFKLVIHKCSGEVIRRIPIGRYWGGWN